MSGTLFVGHDTHWQLGGRHTACAACPSRGWRYRRGRYPANGAFARSPRDRNALLEFHQHNVRTRLPQLLARLQAGDRVALVSDAGTPGISDPGVELVSACVDAQIAVDPVPGVSAPLAAAVVSGFPLIPLTIFGFPPLRAKDRITGWHKLWRDKPHSNLFREPSQNRRNPSRSCYDFGWTTDCSRSWADEVASGFLRGTCAEILPRLRLAKGELTVVVGPNELPQISSTRRQTHRISPVLWTILAI